MPLKRKRPEPPASDTGRPSPHRPGDAAMAQHDRDDAGGRGGRGRKSRGGLNRRDSSQGLAQGRGGNTNHARSPTTPRPVAPSSQASAPSQPAAVTQPTPAPTPARKIDYSYDKLTDARVKAWDESGRETILQYGRQSRDDEDTTELSALFQEFIHAVIDGRLNPADAGSCVMEILGDQAPENGQFPAGFAPHFLFLDSLAIVMESDADLYRPSLRPFLVATGVSPTHMRQVLDAPILQQLGLIRDNFARLGVRQATNLLYRQANYNLLREETEGYSKLITELFTTSGASVSPEVAEQTFERIKALIGTFDLDVGRSLDVALDVAAAVLIKQCKFFVRFLRISSWWPRDNLNRTNSAYAGGLPAWASPGYPQWSTTDDDEAAIALRRTARDIAFWDRTREVHLAAFLELGGRQVSKSDIDRWTITNGIGGEDTIAHFAHQWVRETNTLPPPGNRVAAQLLGFKLRFYNSESREHSDILPANLLYLAALLIKIGFISLVDIYPHLSPADDKMDDVQDKQMKILEEEERQTRGGPMNALLTAGVLPEGDDDNPTSMGAYRREPLKKPEAKKPDQEQKQTAAQVADEKPKLPEPLEQKVRLLLQLLTIGALPESLFILGRFPWIPEAFSEVLERIHRILHISVEKVYNESRPIPAGAFNCPAKGIPDLDQSGLPKGSVRLTKLPTKKVYRWPFPDKFDANETQNYRFYWDEWTDNIPVCQTVDDVLTLCNTFINISGVNIGKDEVLLSKLASIGAKSLSTDKSEQNLSRWHDLLRRLLLPALSHTHANASVVNALWDLLKHYPITTRYVMYAEWFEGQTSRIPAMKKAFAKATAETRGTMKRVSLTNLSEMAKQLAKTSYASPGIVFRVAFEQLESYPNLIEAFVECAKYFTDMSYDVLVWSLLSSLGKSRSRTQADHALTTSKWLSALSRFCGKVFRRYSLLDPTPVLQYVNDQLLRNNSTDLIILKEFCSSMGGIVDAADFTDYQVLSMAGGEYLRRHTLIRGQDRRFDNIKSSKRLMRALTDSNLAARLLLNLSQYRQTALFQVPEDEAHIKYLSSIVDDTNQILIQYLDFLWSNLDAPAFDKLVPSIPQLMSSYGLDTSVAFLIGRTSLVHRMYPWKSKKKDQPKEKPQTEADKDGDISMSDSKASNGAAAGSITEAASNDEQVGAQQPTTSSSQADARPSQKPDESSLIRSALQPIIDSVQETHEPHIWQMITPEFYATFWSLQLGDLFCPDKIYRQERERLKAEELALSRDRSDMTRKGQERKMEKRKELMQLQIGLSEECGEHLLRQAKWKFYLTKQFQVSFPDPKAKPELVADILLEQCFLPRVLLSTADAEYTFKFIKSLHEWNAPGFKLMSLYDRLFNANRLRSLIFTSTVREAEHLGRFLKLILEDLSRWHKNELVSNEKDSKASKDQPRLGAYDKEGRGPSDQPRLGFAVTFDANGQPETFVEHSQFRDILFRWHKNLNTAFKTCLGGTEWMHIRNAITVLRAVMDFFPAVDFMATQFSSQLQKISQQEAASKTAKRGEEAHRVDLSVAAQGAMSELQKRKPKWVMVQAFRPNTVGGSQGDADKGAPHLRATAQEFKPQSTKTPGDAASAADEEDGEVQDGKDTNPQPAAASGGALPAKPSVTSRDLPRREVTPAGGPARSLTPKPAYGPKPTGPRDPRSNTLPDRPPHNLPSRPDVPIPTHFGQGRGTDRREVRDTRAPRDGPRDPRDPREVRDPRGVKESSQPRNPREDWQQEFEHQERLLEQIERRLPEATRDVGRVDVSPRVAPQEKPRAPRDVRESQHRVVDAPSSSTSQSAPAGSSELQINPDRAALFGPDGSKRASQGSEFERSARPGREGPKESVNVANSARPGMVGDNSDNTPSRVLRDDGRQRSARPLSPRRNGRFGHDSVPPSGGHDDRLGGRTYPPEPWGTGRDPRERSPLPGNYRGDRPMDRDDDRGAMERGRNPSGFHPPNSRGQELEHVPGPYQDQNYGRLNPVQSAADVPSGPRGRGRGNTRGGYGGHYASPGGQDGRYGAYDPQRPPSPDRHPPTGPSSSGRGRRGAYESGPSTPSGPFPGSHMDRARNMGHGLEMHSPASSNATPSSGIHPDRMAPAQSSGQPLPPPGQQPHGHGRHQTYMGNTPDRSGPGSRQSAGSAGPVTPTDPSTAPPSGPYPQNEQRPRQPGGGMRQLAGINNMLQQAQDNMHDGSRNVNNRRNQPRQMLGNSDAQVLTGGSPVSTPAQERQNPMRTDPSGRGPSDGDDASGRADPVRNFRDRDSRSSHTSRLSSRERDGERGAGWDRESKEQHRDYRERRSGAGMEGGAEEREARRMTPRDAGGDREVMVPPGGREPMVRDGRHRNDGPGMPRGEDWGPPRAGRGGPREGGGMRSDAGPRPEGGLRPEEWREPRDNRGHKRRSEEGTGALASERDKRTRR